MRIKGIAMAAVALAGAVAMGGELKPTAEEAVARETLARELPRARLLWTRGDRIYHATLGRFEPRPVTDAKPKADGARWSPDGSRFLYVRNGKSVWTMSADFADAREALPGAHDAFWTRDGQAITAIADDEYRVLKLDLDTGRTTVLYDARQKPYNGQKIAQAAELDVTGRYLLVFRREPGHASEIVDLRKRRYIANRQLLRGDCAPAWSPDGSYVISTARTGSRPVLRADFDAAAGKLGESRLFVGLSGLTKQRYYCHGERVSNDGEWVAFDGLIFGGTAQRGRREIYLWRIGRPQESVVRFTFHTAEDMHPSLFVRDGRYRT